MEARGDYCNLQALVDGRVSGRINEWPWLKTEARTALEELAILQKQLEEARKDTKRLDLLERFTVDVFADNCTRMFYRHPDASDDLRYYIDSALADTAKALEGPQ